MPPKSAEWVGIGAAWSLKDPNAKRISDFMINEGKSAGYTVWTFSGALVPNSYTVYFGKGGKAYGLTILGDEQDQESVLSPLLHGVMHIKINGAQNAELDLPIDDATIDANSQRLNLVSRVDSGKCQNCEYYVLLSITGNSGSGFKGAGTYDNLTAIVIPGNGNYGIGIDPHEYSKGKTIDLSNPPKDCGLVAKDNSSGTFDCKGLQLDETHPSADALNISGTYNLPAEVVAAQATQAAFQPTFTPRPKGLATSSVPEPTETEAPALATTDCAIVTLQEASAILGGQADQRLNDAFPTDQVDFATDTVSATESDCSYVAGSNSVTYNVYKPDQTKPSDLAKLWTDSKNADSSRQDIKGIGDDAYSRNGTLRVKKGNTYVTISVEIPEIHQNGAAGAKKQLDMEKQFAQKAVSRLP